MIKQEILNEYKKQEDKICLAQILDKIEACKIKEKIEITDFFNMYEISIIKNFLKKIKFTNYILYGGYEDAERNILIVYPENYTKEMIEKNYEKIINIIKIELPKGNEENYTHRNYLGGIVKLGLKREKIGDIIVSDIGADIITKTDFSEILLKELPTLTRFQSSKITIENISELRKQELKIEDIKIIVPSLRLDNFVSDLAKTSRSKAVQIINQERVFINGQNETKVSKQIKLNDVITIRGKGRFVIKEFTGTTRSGRSVIRIEKYI